MPQRVSRPNPAVPAWHSGFLAMLPAILTHVRISFRHLDPEARQEAVQNCVANATLAYARLHALGKVTLAYPTVLARYAVAQTRDGRRVGGHLNVRDVLSEHCQQHKGLLVERLDLYGGGLLQLHFQGLGPSRRLTSKRQ